MTPPGRADHLDIDVGDALRLHVERGGTGPPLLLLHGFMGAAASWSALTDELSPRFTTLAVDLPGHGRSTAPSSPARYSLDRFADDLELLLDALGIARIAALGYSLGGRAALRFALAHPDRCAALVLESASPGIADGAARARRAASDHALADDLDQCGVRAFVDRWEQLPLWESQRTLPAAIRAAQREIRVANRGAGLANSLRGAGAGADPSVHDRLGGLDVPTLVVAGALDEKYVSIGRAMSALIPSVRLTVVPRAGHAVHLEQPVALAEVVGAFLSSVAEADGGWRR